MEKIMVYFSNGKKAPFDRDHTSFVASDGAMFSFGDSPDCDTYSHILEHEGAVVNWANVSFVQLMQASDSDD